MFLIAFLTIALLILMIILLSRVNGLTLRVRTLQQRLDALEGVSAAPPPLPQGDRGIVAPAAAASGPVQAMPTVRRAQKPSRSREEWEALIGGKVLNRIGAVALIVAVGLFLKYAFDQRLISETLRVLIGGLAGLLALAGAYRTRAKGFEIFAQGLVGAGISILYLSVYSSFNFYHLVPQWVAFVLMAVVTGVTLVHGVHYNSLAVALLGWAGGFLTPIMLSTGQSNEVGLFTYVALLDVGLIGILLIRTRWWVLEPLTFAGTWILYAAWYAEYYVPDDLLVTLFFVMLFWALFYGIDVLRLSREFHPSLAGTILGGANALVVFVALYSLIDPDYHAWMGLVTLLFGAVYLMTLLGGARRREIGRGIEMQYMLTAIALGAVAFGIQFSGFETVTAWSILSAGIVWGSRRWSRPYAFYAGAAIVAAAFVKFLAEQNIASTGGIEDIQILFNIRSLALVALFSASLLSALVLAAGESTAAKLVRSALYYGAALSVLMLLSLELNDVFRQRIQGLGGDDLRRAGYAHVQTMAVVMGLYTVPVVWAGMKRSIHPFIVSGAAVLMLATLLGVARGFAYDPLSAFEPLVNVRLLALLMLATLGAWQAHMFGLRKADLRWASAWQLTARMMVVVVFFTLITGEVLDYFGLQIRLHPDDQDARARLGNLRQLSISGGWVLYSAAMMGFGLWKKVRAIRIAAFVLFGISILKIFIYDLSFLEMLYRIFSFVALGIVLLAVSYAYQRYRHVIFGTEAPIGSGQDR